MCNLFIDIFVIGMGYMYVDREYVFGSLVFYFIFLFFDCCFLDIILDFFLVVM